MSQFQDSISDQGHLDFCLERYEPYQIEEQIQITCGYHTHRSKNYEPFKLSLRTTQTTGNTEAESVCIDLSDMSKNYMILGSRSNQSG